MINLRAQVWNTGFDDTFWDWALREFDGARKWTPGSTGTTLHYGALGMPEVPERSVALLWELYPEMKRWVGTKCDQEIAALHLAAEKCARRTVSSSLVVPEYVRYGPVDVLPIGVDTDLFKPRDKTRMRIKHNLTYERLGFWCGTRHPMKGRHLLHQYRVEHPDAQILEVFKGRYSQPQFAEVMSACDYIVVTNRLRPWSMVEWEAMATGLDLVDIGDREREFTDWSRDKVFEVGWDRLSAKKTWMEYLAA